MCPKKVRHKRVRITSWVRTSLAGICCLQCLARRESAVAPLWCGLWRCSALSGAYDGVGERGDVALEGAEDMWVRFPSVSRAES